ncbi:uncharacterized protein N7511_004547 [Penicillium nucicola]|uniref:uncharacterized protein n=1 Tax=Penicillium nucicola TaxID=1850975 RepID=UPI002545136A|nr:uncharacterized protein N7511_004547 [Penicillium nucicola]KAJ5766931.1 hypothetical protein N7511_004547 [Penicillium nucicola]
MEGLDMINPTGVFEQDHNLPFEKTPERSLDPMELSTDESGQSVNDSGPSTPTDDIDSFDDDGNYESNGGLVMRPYAIEEPDDEPQATLPRRKLPCLPDHFEHWQRDLKDSLNGFDVRPDSFDATTYSAIRNKGQKRKSVSIASSTQSHSGSHFCRRGTISTGTHHQVNDHYRKRRRGCSEESQDYSDTDSFCNFREPNANERSNSSAESQTTDMSSAESLNEFAADKMDID